MERNEEYLGSQNGKQDLTLDDAKTYLKPLYEFERSWKTF